MLPIFKIIEAKSGVPDAELYQVFNMGIGMVAIVSADKADAVLRFIRAQKHKAWLIGEVVKGRGRARVCSCESPMSFNPLKPFAALTAILIFCGAADAAPETNAAGIDSPNGRLAVDFRLTTNGAPVYAIQLDGKPVLQDSRLGLVRDDADFSQGLQLFGVRNGAGAGSIRNSHGQAAGEHLSRQPENFSFADRRRQKNGHHLSGFDDGVAFRYGFPETNAAIRRLTGEVSSFHFLPGTRAWLQPMQVAKTGFHESNPAYEEFYQKNIPAGTPSTLGAGWVYPALFRSGDTWLLVSESSLPRNYCATHLRDQSPDGEYSVGLADPRENLQTARNPESPLPWLTPWRLIVIGGLKTIAESTLGIDLAAPAKSALVHPAGKASWSWPLLGDSNTKYDVQKTLIDYAAQMHWRYCLMDAWLGPADWL